MRHLILALLAVLAFGRVARADALGDVAAQRAQVSRLDGERAQLDGRRVRLEHESQELAGEIDHIKAEPAGVRRDLKLQELLATQQAKATELEQVAAELRGRSASLQTARRALMGACDRALSGSLPEAKRLELARLRTAQVTILALPPQPLGIGKAQPALDPLDSPRELEEKADLLRDSQDKLKREVSRLSARIDDVERRRHLRERAGAVDEDWFGESSSNRRVARATSSGATSQNAGNRGSSDSASPTNGATQTGGAAGAPAPSAGAGSGGGATSGGSTGGSTPPSTPSTGGSTGNFTGAEKSSDSATVLRNLVDPATLDELRRADGSDDLERQVRALKRAQGELQGLANDLEKRAKSLSQRASELKHRK